MSATNNNRIDRVVVRMYRMGTGDCFTVKFLKGNRVSFTMMIDCGCWSGSAAKLKPFLEELKADVEDHIDALVVTHEHKDHVLGFERGKEMFTDGNFRADRIWMAWTERDGDPEVERWKRNYCDKRKLLAVAATRLRAAVESRGFRQQLAGAREDSALHARRQMFADVLQGFADLHAASADDGALAGMAVVKNDIAGDNVSYFEPGDVIENIPGLDGVRLFVLGPPTLYDDVKQEEGPAGDAYEHNDQLEDAEAFAAALGSSDDDASKLLPFDKSYVSADKRHRAAYDAPSAVWRRIDYDWLFSAGSLALRMSTMTNNLSLVLAIEFVDSGKVLLFPGDAEFGSWRSWHRIAWGAKVPALTTEKLLNRVIFYKVAHHLSHHGTARRIGLDMMTSPDLVAMATLDYDVIPPGWTSTMPNAAIIKDLLRKTKGRTIVMNSNGLLYDRKDGTPLKGKIEQLRNQMGAEERKTFVNDLVETEHYFAITLDV